MKTSAWRPSSPRSNQVKKLEAKHRANQQRVAKLQKARQDADLKAIKEAEATLAEKRSERQALEQRVKDLEVDNGKYRIGNSATSTDLAHFLPELAKKTRELDNLVLHSRSRVEQRQGDLVSMRSKLDSARRSRRELVAQMTTEFESKRDALANAHRKIRKVPGMKTMPAVVSLEEQHRDLIVETAQVLKLLSGHHDGLGTSNGIDIDKDNSLSQFSTLKGQQD